MDRGDNSLSVVINTIQRDLEELKTAQTKPISTGQIADGAITTEKLNSELSVDEVVYEFEQANNSSSNVGVAIDVDLTKYKSIRVVVYQSSSVSTSFWSIVSPCNSSLTALSTHQIGYEVSGSSISAINRDSDQLCAAQSAKDKTSMMEVVIHAGIGTQWPSYQAHGYSESSAQAVGGVIKTNASNVAYIYVTLVTPNAGARVVVYGRK